MKLSIKLTLMMLIFASVTTVHAKKANVHEKWAQCRDKAESSVKQSEVGIIGVEAEIKIKCGEPPAYEPSLSTGAIGMHPYDLVRSKAWKNKFVKITKEKYKSFIERLEVSSNTTFDGEWIVGEGLAPHMGDSDEAVLAINSKTNEVFAAMMENGNQFSKFGFDSWKNAPTYLQNWFNERSNGN